MSVTFWAMVPFSRMGQAVNDLDKTLLPWTRTIIHPYRCACKRTANVICLEQAQTVYTHGLAQCVMHRLLALHSPAPGSRYDAAIIRSVTLISRNLFRLPVSLLISNNLSLRDLEIHTSHSQLEWHLSLVVGQGSTGLSICG